MKRSIALPGISGNGCRWSRITAPSGSSAAWPRLTSFSPSPGAGGGAIPLADLSLTMPNEYKAGEARGVVARYRSYLAIEAQTPVVSLGEGNTPLLPAARLSKEIGRGCEVFLKCEGLNPTGSFKDRGMTLAVSKAVEHGARTLICASTGNTSASAAAYAARAGLNCAVILPAQKIASGKIAQAFAYGAQIILIA